MTGPSQLYVEQDMASPELVPFLGGELAVHVSRRPGESGANEDAALRVELGSDRGVLAVADGAGGLPAGAQASETALRCVRDGLEASAPGSMRESILSGFDRANQEVADLGVGAATTLALVRIEGRTVRSFHAGDSVVLVVGQRGKRKLETIAHSPVGYALEAGLLDERDAMEHDERHLVSNLVGTPDMRIEMSASLELAPRDTLLLASDGVSDNLHVEELVELIRKGPLPAAAECLAAMIRNRMLHPSEAVPSKPDDVAFMLFRPGHRGESPPG